MSEESFNKVFKDLDGKKKKKDLDGHVLRGTEHF